MVGVFLVIQISALSYSSLQATKKKTLDTRVLLSFYLVIECLIVPVRACWSFVTFTVGIGISMEQLQDA